MDNSAIVPMEVFNSLSKSDQITALCDYHECSDKKRKLHRDQYVKRGWNPHPPRRFLSWWNKDGPKLTEAATGRGWALITATRAFNCEAVRQVYANHT